jgi:hypothetical protein
VPTPAGLESWTPTDLNIDNGGQITFGVRLTVNAETEIGGVAYRAPATIGGTYTWALWTTTSDDDPNGSGTGTLIDSDSATSASLVAADWNYLDLPLTLSPGVVYTASVHTTLGRYVREANAFQSSGYSGDGVILLASGTDPNPPALGAMVNGQFLDGASGYPHTAFLFANYGITVWLPDAAPDPVTGALAASPPLPTAAIAGVESMSGALSAFPSLPTCAVEGVVAVPVSAVLSAVTTSPAAAIVGTHPVTERPASWYPLLDMVRQAKRNAGALVRATSCPKCGTPLEAARGVLHCPFDGSVY